MTDNTETNTEQVAQLTSQVEELNKKIDTLNAKLEKSEANSTAILEQQKTILAATTNTRSQEILRQTVSHPTGFIAKETVAYVIKALEKNQKSKTQQWMVTRGRGVAEAAVAAYIGQKLPQLNWYGTTCTGTESKEQYHMTTRTSFPVEINTGVPFVGKVALAKVLLDVESDVNTKTNETSNVKCHLAADHTNTDLWTSLQEDFVNWAKPHKTLWSILHPIGMGILKLARFMKKETNFSIPFAILFFLTLLVYPRIFPAAQIWGALGYNTVGWGLFGIRPINILFGIINGIIWGGIFWLVVRFNIIPGMGKVLKFIRTQIWPGLKHWFMNPYRRWGTIAAILAIIILVILWRVGVFEPPPPLQIAGESIPNSRAGDTFNYNFVPEGGKGPYTFTLDTATLPAGLTFDPLTGNLTGSVATPGSYPITIQVTDSSKEQNIVNKEVTLNFSTAGSLIIVNTSLSDVKAGEKYSAQIITMGGYSPFRWGISAGYLPPGLVLDAASGTISGEPTALGDFAFTVTVDDSSNPGLSYDQAYTLTVK